MNCLCGHFESCEFCRTQPPTPDEQWRIKAMHPEDWERVLSVPRPPIVPDVWKDFFKRFGEACARAEEANAIEAAGKKGT